MRRQTSLHSVSPGKRRINVAQDRGRVGTLQATWSRLAARKAVRAAVGNAEGWHNLPVEKLERTL